MEYFKPDETWEVFGIKSKEEFISKLVVEPKFHKNVPEDLNKSFRTVSFLLAHSYYHWPMFDEALSKALLVMEMAVKLKAKKLNIDLKLLPNKKGVQYDKRLSDLIKEVCTGPFKALIEDFGRARNLRNYKMHPSKYTFMGGLSKANYNCYLFINIINQLFLPENELNDLIIKQEHLKEKLLPFKSGLLVLKFDDKKILIDGFHIFKYREFEEKPLLMLYINPLTTKVDEQYSQKKYPDPLILSFSKFEITDNGILGSDLEGEPIKIYFDDNEDNLKTYLKYNKELSKVTETDLNMFMQADSQRALWKIEKLIYENSWELADNRIE